MAGDWVKMRTDLYRDPKVCLIADALMNVEGKLARFVSQHCQRDMTVTRNVMRNVTVGALVTVWGVTRHRGKRDGDGLIVRGATLSVIDDMADLPGFGDAMAAVGWVVETESGLEFPNFFDEYNVDPADELKAKNAERQRKFREKRNAESNVTVALQSNDREEKRRVNTPLTPQGGDHVNGRRRKRDQFRPAPSDRSEASIKRWIRDHDETRIPRDQSTVAAIVKAGVDIKAENEFFAAVERIARGET